MWFAMGLLSQLMSLDRRRIAAAVFAGQTIESCGACRPDMLACCICGAVGIAGQNRVENVAMLLARGFMRPAMLSVVVKFYP